MKHIYIILLFILFLSTVTFAGEKKVLVEIFTNAHCPLCPPAHSALDQYLQTANGSNIEYIYYHMAFPYNTDELYKHNPTDSQNKNTFYGSYTSTPKAFFNGIRKGNNYSSWGGELDALVAEQSKIDLSVSGNTGENSFTITAKVTKTADLSESDLTINYVVVENINNYTGRNGISNHKNVMRKIVNPVGDPFEINLNETKELSATINFNEAWNKDNLKIIVFVQSNSTKEVFQSSSIGYNELGITGIKSNNLIATKFVLEQNYPNPFNPTTTIQYSIPIQGVSEKFVTLKVYDVLGKEIATLVNKNQAPGNYTLNWNASNQPNGVYLYTLTVGSFSKTRKLLLMK